MKLRPELVGVVSWIFRSVMRLNRYIAQSGVCSRRKADRIILEGKVKVNSKIVLQPWTEVKGNDSVVMGGTLVSYKEYVYLAVNKPRGVTATLSDRFAGKKIVDLIPPSFGRVFPAGRLDKDSRGLIVLTNDGPLCYRITHPKFNIEKEYRVTVQGQIKKSHLKKMKKGISAGGDFLKVHSAYISAQRLQATELRLVVCEGKKRHLRRLFNSLGFPVFDLKRVRVGGLRLGKLKEGAFKVLSPETIYNKILGESKK